MNCCGYLFYKGLDPSCTRTLFEKNFCKCIFLYIIRRSDTRYMIPYFHIFSSECFKDHTGKTVSYICFMKFLSIIFIFSFFCFSKLANAQDTICTSYHSCFAAKITSVERNEIWFKYLIEENGVLQHMRTSELQKIKYQNGEEKYFVTFLKQAALGVTFYSTLSPDHSYDIDKYADGASASFLSAGALLTCFYRGSVWAISISSGYAHKSIEWRENFQNTSSPPHSYHPKSISIESSSIPVYVTPRVYLSTEKTSPFFDFTLGTEYFQNGTPESNPTLKNPFIWKTGLGIQTIVFPQWLLEFKLGFGKRPDYYRAAGRQFLVGDFELSFYRILYSHITH